MFLFATKVATGLGGDLGKQHQDLFDVGLVGERDLADADQIGQHDRQGGLQPLDQLACLRERWAAVVQNAGDGLVVGLQFGWSPWPDCDAHA